MNSTAKSALVASAMLATTALMSGQASAGTSYIDGTPSFGGSGCSSGSEVLTPFDTDGDGKADQFSLITPAYVAESGPGTGILDRRKYCNINVQIHVPKGCHYSVVDVKYHGFYDLAKGVRGTQTSIYQFPFFSNSVQLSSTFYGKKSGIYDFTDHLPFASWVWSPCGLSAPLNIMTQLYLTDSRWSSSSITTDQIDGRVAPGWTYNMVWQPCVPVP